MAEIRDIEEKIRELMQKEYRKDTEFRYLIVSTEIGDLGKYITHDPVLNPSARPHGSKEDEVLAYGQAFVQLMALAQLRDVPIEPAFRKGLENWIEADWKRTEGRNSMAPAGNDTELTGISVYNGYEFGIAYVARRMAEIEDMPSERILVTPFAKPEIFSYLGKVIAVVTDYGGRMCHLAVNVRNRGGPVSIVGTNRATELIKTGDYITVDAREEIGKVYLHPSSQG